MKAKLIIEGKEMEVEISAEEYKKLQLSETGYERVPDSDIYFYAHSGGYVGTASEHYCNIDNEYYELANYYSDKTVAENNIRADKLVRQLRRFSVEHRERGVNLNDTNTKKYCIDYDYDDGELRISFVFHSKIFGAIYFDSEETAQAAIDEFRDELVWYFTEYKEGL